MFNLSHSLTIKKGGNLAHCQKQNKLELRICTFRRMADWEKKTLQDGAIICSSILFLGSITDTIVSPHNSNKITCYLPLLGSKDLCLIDCLLTSHFKVTKIIGHKPVNFVLRSRDKDETWAVIELSKVRIIFENK